MDVGPRFERLKKNCVSVSRARRCLVARERERDRGREGEIHRDCSLLRPVYISMTNSQKSSLFHRRCTFGGSVHRDFYVPVLFISLWRRSTTLVAPRLWAPVAPKFVSKVSKVHVDELTRVSLDRLRLESNIFVIHYNVSAYSSALVRTTCLSVSSKLAVEM